MKTGVTAAAIFLAGVSAAALATPVMAQESEGSKTASRDFDIEAQSLDGALLRFAEQADIDLIYSPDLVRSLNAPALKGRFATADALKRLLSGSGLTAMRLSETVYSLQGEGAWASEVGAAANISGLLVNKATGAALPGAKILVVGTTLTTTTDERGHFFIPAVPGGARELIVSYLGEPDQSFAIPTGSFERQRMTLSFGKDSGEIVVMGYSSSLQRALNQQLRAANSATIVSSDLLGSFPAETVSEALRRVPGVAFGRADDTGEGQRITVRGFSSEAINIQLNGLDLQGTGFERTVDLSGFLADNVSQITIHKSLLPSHESSGSGGLVEIETKSGLDYDKLTLSLGIEGETNFDRDFGGEYQVNGTLGARITDNLGVVATVQYRKTDRLNYGADIADSLPPVLPAGYTSVTLVPASMRFPFDDELNKRLVSGVSYLKRDREEENLTASLNFAWDISSTTRLRLDLQRIQRDAYTETSRTTASFLTSGVDMPIAELDGEVRRRTVLASLRPNLSYNVTDIGTVQDSISFRGETNLDRWTFKYKAGYSKSRSRSKNVNFSLLGNAATNLVDLIDPATIVINPDDDAARTPRVVDGGVIFQPNGLPILSLSQAGADYLNDPANYSLTSANRTLTNSPTRSYLAEGSARFQPEPDWFDYIEVGGKYDRSTRDSADELFASTSVGSLKAVESYLRIAGRETGLDYFGSGLTDSSVLSDVGAGSFRAPFLNGNSVSAIFDGLSGLLVDDPSTPFNEARFTYADRRAFDPILDTGGLVPTKTVEERSAGYVESKLTFGIVELVGGARYERFYRSGRSLSSPSVRLASGIFEPRETFVLNNLVEFTDLSGTQDIWTPSAIINIRPQSNIVARLAYFRSTVNPDLRLIRRSRSVSLDLRPTVNRAVIREANPDLKPTKTDNFDLNLSYYFNDSPGLLSASFFYKKVRNNFTNVLFQDGADSSVRDDVIAYFGDLANTRPDLVAFNDETIFERNRPVNGEGGTIYGFELEAIRQLNFLPGFLKDFTFLGNLTYTKGDFPTLLSGRNDDGTLGSFTVNRPLADQAAWVYNASLSYERGGFEGRVIYSYQSATPDVYEIHGLDQELPSYDTLDMRLSYSFEKLGTFWTVYLQGDDLLRGSREIDLRRAVTSKFVSGGANYYYPEVYQFNGGRTVTMGLKARF